MRWNLSRRKSEGTCKAKLRWGGGGRPVKSLAGLGWGDCMKLGNEMEKVRVGPELEGLEGQIEASGALF